MLTIFAKHSILDVRQGFEYSSDKHNESRRKSQKFMLVVSWDYSSVQSNNENTAAKCGTCSKLTLNSKFEHVSIYWELIENWQLKRICFLCLTILTGKDWCFTQFSTEMAVWLLLIFLICLHNQNYFRCLSSPLSNLNIFGKFLFL